MQEQGRIVGLAVDTNKLIIFWSDVSVSKKGIWRGEMSGGNALQNPHRIVESGMHSKTEVLKRMWFDGAFFIKVNFVKLFLRKSM